jgi:serine/threonine-protein kinase RsbW
VLGSETITLIVPGKLELRDVAVRTVAAACARLSDRQIHQPDDTLDLSDEFDAQMVSAFSEIFNNVAMHSYRLRSGEIRIEITVSDDGVTIELTDSGEPFDLGAVPSPQLEGMPDHGLGIHIAKSFVDELTYEPGPPNVWRLTKYAGSSAGDVDSAVAGRARAESEI